MTGTPGVCPKCQMPLEKTGSGSLTQWIMVCRCNLPEAQKEQSLTVNVCAECGKRMGAGREGTLTQWIFRADLCSCMSPKITTVPQEEFGQPEPEEVEELSLDSASFPVERYGPLRVLGTGAAGSVYLCRDRLLSKNVAVKVLNNLNSEQLMAFQREAKATSQLNHSNIVKVLNFGVTESGAPYMVLDYIEGNSLEQLLEQRGRLGLHDCIAVFDQVCDALKYAHSHAMFHRDLKPGNILVLENPGGEPDVRLIDFGVGEFLQEDIQATDSQGNAIVGTPSYMSPDQARGRPYDARSEIYSFGCVFFEALTGRPPFRGKNPLQTISLHAHSPAPTLSETVSSVKFPEKLEEVIENCLHKSPDERYQNVDDLKQAIVEASYQIDELEPEAQVATEVPPRSSNKSQIGFAIVTVVICTVIGALAIYRNLSVEPTVVKSAAQEEGPKLNDAIDSMDAKRWHIGRDPDGADTWASSPEATDEDFKYLAEQLNVTHVNIGLTDTVTGTGAKYLVKQPLESFIIQSTALSDAGLAELAKIKTIKRISLSLATQISAAGVKKLGALPNLTQLAFHVMPLPEGTLHEVAKLKGLEGLSFYNSKNISLEGLAELQRELPNLSVLNLTGTLLDHNVVPVVSKMSNVYELRMQGLKLKDDNLDLLANMPRLTTLDLSITPISDKGLMKLVNCRHLAILNIDDCKNITRVGMLKFKKKAPRVDISIMPNKPREDEEMLHSLSPLDE